MIFINLLNGRPVAINFSHPHCFLSEWAKRVEGKTFTDPKMNGWMSERDVESFEEAESLARFVTAMTGKTYLAYDRGDHCYPRFGLMDAPKIGDPVSYSFNGDTYPCGFVSKITPTWQIQTTEGKKFRRPGRAAGWRMEGGTWSLVAGHIYEQNPSF